MRRLKFLSLALLISPFIFCKPVFSSNVVINEFLAHPSSGKSEWVEFYNPDQIDLSSYWLDDDMDFNSDTSSSPKKSLATLINSSSKYPYIEISSFLNNSGDYVVLFSNKGAIVDHYQYTTDPGIDKSVGRSPDGGGWTALSSTSQGGPNDNQISTPTISPTATSTVSPTSSQSSDLFTISNLPSQIDSTQSFTVAVNLSLSGKPNTQFYLKGAFKKDGSSNYFGLTKVNSSWIKNGSSYNNQLPITTDSSGNWSGNLEVKPDTDDSGFTGSGSYIFKVAYYTSYGDGPNWSNETAVNINSTSNQDGTKNTSLTSNKMILASPTLKSPLKIIANLNPSILGTASSNIQSISTPSSQSAEAIEVKSEKEVNFFIFLGIGLMLVGLVSVTFIYYRFKIKS